MSVKCVHSGGCCRVKAIVLRQLLTEFIPSEMRHIQNSKTQHLYPGDYFHIPAMVKHKEKYGPEGCVFGSREFD